MRYGALIFFFLSGGAAWADLSIIARKDYIRSQEQELANRLLLQSSLSTELSLFKLYFDGFAELESISQQRDLRRSPDRGYLQELYLELNWNSLYFRLGRQAVRWSESWTLPSLDIWTARKWNRLFLDPFADQLNHPTGLLMSYAQPTFSVDVFGAKDLATSELPQPLDSPESSTPTSPWGIMPKWTLGGFGFSIMYANISSDHYYGASTNYAFESFVPKLEIGQLTQDQKFISYGSDIFYQDLSVFIQLTTSETYSDTPEFTARDLATSYYLSISLKPGKHDIQLQGYLNPLTKDQFTSISYGYDLTDYINLSIFAQQYEGDSGLFQIYNQITKGQVIGLRFELSKSVLF